MTVYFVTLSVIAILGSLEYNQRMKTSYYEEGYLYQRKNSLYFFLIVIVFLFVGGFRYQVGTDYYSYYAGWTTSWSSLLTKFKTFDEPLIYLLTNICRMIWDEGIFVIFVENAVTVLLVLKGIRDWEDDSWTMPLMMYILYCGWTSSFNGVRQALAGAIIFAFSKRSERNWILRYMIVCFVAFLVHKTAIFMFPVLILANRKIDFRQIIIIIGTAIALPYIGNRVLSFIGTTLDNNYALHAVNIIRVVVSCIPLLLIAFVNSDFRDDNRFIINMAIFNALITVSTRNSALMYRFSDYTVMYMMLFIPKLSCIFRDDSRKIFRTAVIVLYFVYFITEVRSGNGYLNNFQWAFGHFGGA